MARRLLRWKTSWPMPMWSVPTAACSPHGGYHLGAIIFAPHIDYPPHIHPAVELYYLVAGEGEWQRGDEGWTTHTAGALIHHPASIAHATRTAETPVLALVCLTGDVDAPPVLL